MNDINDLLNNRYDKMQGILLRNNTPKILVKNGISNLPMLANPNHILSNILSEHEAKNMGLYNNKSNYHSLGVKLYLEVVNNLDNPIAIYKHKNGKDYIIVTNYFNSDNEQIIVPIYIVTNINYKDVKMKTNKIKSIYGKKNIKKYLYKQLKDSNYIMIYKKTSDTPRGQSSNDINLMYKYYYVIKKSSNSPRGQSPNEIT